MQAIRYGEALNYLFEFCLSTGKEFPKDWRKIDSRFFNGIKDNKLKDEVKMCVEVITQHSIKKRDDEKKKDVNKTDRRHGKSRERLFELEKIINHDIHCHYAVNVNAILESESISINTMYSTLNNRKEYQQARNDGKKILLVDRNNVIHESFDDVYDVSDRLGIHPNSVYKWCKRGNYHFDNKKMIRASDYAKDYCKNKEFHYEF